MAWSPDDRFVIAGGNDRYIHVWEAATGVRVFGLPATPTRCRASPTAPTACTSTGSYDNTLRSGMRPRRLPPQFHGPHRSYSVAIANDGRRPVLWRRSSVRWWDCDRVASLAPSRGIRGRCTALPSRRTAACFIRQRGRHPPTLGLVRRPRIDVPAGHKTSHGVATSRRQLRPLQ